jgi:hypothetical protein
VSTFCKAPTAGKPVTDRKYLFKKVEAEERAPRFMKAAEQVA